MDEVLELCRQAVANGVARLCACPHAFGRLGCPGPRALDALGELREPLRREGIPLEVAQGMECLLVPDLAERVAAGRVLTLAGSPYLVVELPDDLAPAPAACVLFELALAGVAPGRRPTAARAARQGDESPGCVSEDRRFGPLIVRRC